MEVPASGFNVFLSFAVKPGLPLEQVQQGVTEVIDELGYRLGSFLNEKDLQSNADKYEVAKLECEQQLQDWQSRLSEATLAVLRADRSRSELSKLRESYWREVQNLRQQLYRKERAEESGKDFVPASVDLFSKEAGSGFNDLILEQMNRMEDEHQAEIASWKQKNAELLTKMKSKVLGIELATCDVDVQTEIDAKEEVVSVTTSQSCGFEGVSFNNFVDVMTFPIRDGESRDEDLSRHVGATVATVSVDSEMQTDSVWQDLELEDTPKGQTGEMKVRTSTEMTDSYQVESDESDESLSSDEESLERKDNVPNFQEILSEQDPIVMDDETRSDVEGVPVETEPVAPTLLGVSSRTPTSPPARSPRWSRFHRPHLQIKTSLDDETFQMPKQETGSNGSNGDHGSNGSTANSKGKDRIFVTSDEKTTHPITPKANQSPISSSRSASASKKTKLPGLRVERVEKDLHDSSTSRSPPLRRSSVTSPDEKDTKDTKDTKELTFPVCSLGSVCRVESAMTRPSQRIISRPRLSSRRHSTRD